jgi:hypothetical protein
MGELNHPTLIKGPGMLGDISGRGRCADDMRKPRAIRRARNATGSLTDKTCQPQQPSKQAGLEYPTERAKTLLEEMHLVLDNQARKGVEKDLYSIGKRRRHSLMIWRWCGTGDCATGHVQDTCWSTLDPSGKAEHARDPVDRRRALTEQSQLVDCS